MRGNFNFDRFVRPDVQYSVHNMGYTNQFTCGSGELIPCYIQECYPGDRFTIRNAFVVKTLPMTVPVMADYFIYTHYWFVPYRILQSHETIEKGYDTNTFEDYINGVKEGLVYPHLSDDFVASVASNRIKAPITSAVTTGYLAQVQVPTTNDVSDLSVRWRYSLWDYLAFPLPEESDGSDYIQDISMFPIRAYNAVWNTKYRDENIQGPDYDGVGGSNFSKTDGVTIGVDLRQTNILRRNWEKDYFTSMLPWQQKGTPIALPVTSSIASGTSIPSFLQAEVNPTGVEGATLAYKNMSLTGTSPNMTLGDNTFVAKGVPASYNWNIKTQSAVNINSTAFDINDLRLSNSVQRFLEANARGGTKYKEFCLSHFGIAPRDENLNLPLYLGGSKTPLIVSEVTQTSSGTLADSTPQGTLTGKGQSGDANFITKDRVYEHGLILGLFSIMPKPIYSNGVDRMWIKTDLYDWYSPEFANLGEQPIYSIEANGLINDADISYSTIGFQGRWSEMRCRRNVSTSGFRSSASSSSGFYGGMADWTVQRGSFTLNSAHLVCKPQENFWAYPNSKPFIVEFGNFVKMSRPIPALAEPLLVG